MICTIYENIFIKDKPHHISVDIALKRIKDGKSRVKVEEIRAALDKEKAQELKKQLPSVCFSGKFITRFDENIIEHSGFIVLDFDNVEVSEIAAKMSVLPFVYALWTSPSGNGLKVLVRVAEGAKHREHFTALKELFPEVDKSGVNESRVCYESYDPNIYINEKAEAFTKTLVHEQYKATEIVSDERKVFTNLLKWLTNKGGSFSKGERNIYIFKLAGACCRYGIWEQSAANLILSEYPPSNDFTGKEAIATIKSAYKKNGSAFGTAHFERDILVDKKTRREVEIDPDVFDETLPPKDVIYGATVKGNAMDIFNNGYTKISGIGVPKIDERFKSKKGELTGWSGIGNYGKSTFYKWNKLMRVLLYKEKFAAFAPEDNPPEEYYHDFVEMLLGCNCTPFNFDGTPNLNQPGKETYSNAYDFISSYVFYIGPKENAPTVDYILERFLELIIKEKIYGCCIDPWNQVAHDYASFGVNVVKYLENVLGRISRFSQANDVYMDIIIHPKQMPKEANGNYACPDKFDLSDGAMWNNKLDNLLIYHRPLMQTDPINPLFEFHSKKIKRQKTVGKPGVTAGEYVAGKRRFEIDGFDPLQALKDKYQLDFHKPMQDFTPIEVPVKQSSSFFAGFQQNTNRPPTAFWNEP